MTEALAIYSALSGIFETAGLEESEREAEYLLLQTTGLDRVTLYRDNPTLPRPKVDILRASFKRRLKRVPPQYLTGFAEFYGLKILTPEGVFIPRPETELLVEEALRVLRTIGSPNPRVLDLCTGTGCIGLAIGKEMPHIEVYGVDISHQAVEVARSNAETNRISNVSFLRGDLFTPVKGLTFDLIVSNPPYIPSGEIPLLQPEVGNYEPKEALDGGPDGLHYYRRILNEFSAYLRPGGYLLLETGPGQATVVSEMAQQASLAVIDMVKDLTGIERVLILAGLNREASHSRRSPRYP